jgi:general secretion pathway protein D
MEKALGEDRLNVTQAIQIESRLAEKAFLELKTAEGVEVRSLPRFVTMDGQPASLKIGEEMIYPTDFTSPNPAVAPTAGTKPLANTPVPQFDTVAPDDEKPGFRMVGISIDLTPRYEPKYDRINLEMAPQITEFKGYEEFGAGIKVPRFWSWTLNTSVNLRRNHSMIFRGPASEKKREIIIFLQANAFR